jgi:hypothetical protein
MLWGIQLSRYSFHLEVRRFFFLPLSKGQQKEKSVVKKENKNTSYSLATREAKS